MNKLKDLIKKYFSSFLYFYSYLKYKMFVMIGLSIFIGILDGLGLTMFLPLLQMADGSSEIEAESLGQMKIVVEFFENIGIQLNLYNALLIMFIFFSLKGIVFLYSLRYNVRILQEFVATMRMKLTNYFTHYSFKQFVKSDVGRIQNSLTSEISKVSRAYQSYTTGIQQLVMVFVYLGFVFLVDWRFALLVCLGGGLSNLFFNRLFKKTKKQSKELSANTSSYTGMIIQYIANFKYLKATGFLSNYAGKLKQGIKKIEDNNREIGFLSAKISALREPLLIGVICVVILFQVNLIGGNLAGILVSLLFFYRALSGLMIFQNSYNSYLGNVGAIDNLMDFEQHLKRNFEPVGKTRIKSFENSIRLENVDFGYDSSKGVLDNLSLEIPKNKTIAFVGESGSGKTTLVNLLGGLFLPDNGKVFVDDVSFSEMDIASYQSRIGYITQEPVIFNDTIYNNVTLWSERNQNNLKQFELALKKASLWDFVQTELGEQENTLLGNNGINLSGGQKQRISIARELYKNIDILILDEATSALDSETEKKIQMNIDQFKGEYTIIIIAHRLSTIKNADIVYVMDKGRIIEKGTFKELSSGSTRFKTMVSLQEV